MSDHDASEADVADLMPWLIGGLSSASPSQGLSAESVMDAVLAAGMVVDGRRWLASSDFHSIHLRYEAKGQGRKPRSTVEYGRLNYESDLDPDVVPSAEAGGAWWLFKRVLNDLEDIARQRDLPAPPIALRALLDADVTGQPDEGPAVEVSGFPPVSDYAPDDVGSELDALGDDEVLLVLRYKEENEGEGPAAERRLRQENALSRLLGHPLASSKSGNAYAIAYPLPEDNQLRVDRSGSDCDCR